MSREVAGRSTEREGLPMSASETARGTIRDRIIMSVALAKQARYAESVRILRGIIAEDESNAEAWYGLAYCYYKVGNFAPAKMLAERATALGNTSAPALVEKLSRVMHAEHHDTPAGAPAVRRQSKEFGEHTPPPYGGSPKGSRAGEVPGPDAAPQPPPPASGASEKATEASQEGTQEQQENTLGHIPPLPPKR